MGTIKVYKFKEQFDRGLTTKRILATLYTEESGYMVVDSTEHHDRNQGVDSIIIKKLDVNEIYRVDWKLDQQIAATRRITIEAVSMRVGGTVERIYGAQRAVGGKIVKPGWAITSQADLIVFDSPHERRVYELSRRKIQDKWDEIRRFSLEAVQNEGWVTENYYVPISWLRLKTILLRDFDSTPPWKLLPFDKTQPLITARMRGESRDRSLKSVPESWADLCFECNGSGQCQCIVCSGGCVPCLHSGRLINYKYCIPPRDEDDYI